MISQQETFDTVATALIKQGGPSMDPNNGQCLYRGPNGTKCAGGILIPDELYKPEMEHRSVKHEIVAPTLEGHDLHLLYELQSCHDWAAGDVRQGRPWREAITAELRNCAKRFLLSTAVLDELVGVAAQPQEAA